MAGSLLTKQPFSKRITGPQSLKTAATQSSNSARKGGNQSEISDSIAPLKKIKESKETECESEITDIANRIAEEFKIQTIISNDSENQNVIRIFFFGKKGPNLNISLTLIVKTDKKCIDIESSNVKQVLIDSLFKENKKNNAVSFEIEMKEIVKHWLRISSCL